MNRKNILMLLLAATLCILPLSAPAEEEAVSSASICMACGSEMDGVGLTATRKTMSLPLEMPPLMPPLLLEYVFTQPPSL